MAEMDLNFVAAHYAKMSDEEFERIATSEAQGLRPEVLKIIADEIKKRNINPDILKGVIAQRKEYTIHEIAEYAELLRSLPCPVCANTAIKLNGTIAYTVKSIVFFTTYGSVPTIACPDCLDKKNNEAILSTALLGWWGIPWGLINTPVYIYKNIRAKKQNKINDPNNTLLSYTLSHIGRIETYKNNKEKLQEIICSGGWHEYTG